MPAALVNGTCQQKKLTPFTLLPGEELRADEALSDGFVYLTNYRLHIEPPSSKADEHNVSRAQQQHQQQQYQQLQSPPPPSQQQLQQHQQHQLQHDQQQQQQSEQNVDSARQTISLPVGAIDSIEQRDLNFLVVFTKYVQSFALSFQSPESATLWLKHLNDANNLKVEELFCFQFFTALKQLKDTATENRHIGKLVALNQKEVEKHSDPKELVLKEFRRMNFNPNDWRLCELNKEFRFCSSYPQYFIVPQKMTDKELESVGNFRYSRRIPVVVWRHQKNGCVIARSSQPVVGWLGWRSSQDERLLQRILDISIKDTHECNQMRLKENGHRSQCMETPPLLASATSTPPLANGLSASPILPTTTSDTANVVAAHQSTGAAVSSPSAPSCPSSPSPPTPTSSSSSSCESSENQQKSADCNGQSAVATSNGGGHVLGNGTLATNKSMEKLTTENSTTKLLILDARSYAAAFANRAMGGGCECAEYYDNCDVQFMSLNNIHNIRKSFHSLRYICESSQIELPK